MKNTKKTYFLITTLLVVLVFGAGIGTLAIAQDQTSIEVQDASGKTITIPITVNAVPTNPANNLTNNPSLANCGAIVCQPPLVPSSDNCSCVAPSSATSGYVPLAPLPGMPANYDTSQTSSLGVYLNLMIQIFIGICAVLAVIMIVMGGIEYMTSELISNKEHAKEKIRGAIFGLLLALGAYLILYMINPNLLKTDLSSLKSMTVLEAQLNVYTGGGQAACIPVADSSNPCSVASLANAGFTNATQASSICNAESRGNATLGSGVDKCSDGNSFSFGLFQINILAHANEIKDGSGNLVCSGIFAVDPNPPNKVGTSQNDNTLGGCLQRNGTICVKYAAVVTNQAKYQSCKDYITNPANNIKYAAALQSSRNWNQWGANASCHFP